jgi:transposase
MPTIRRFFTNMSVKMSLHKKIYLVLRNNGIKIVKRQDRCGHPGEPGCCE